MTERVRRGLNGWAILNLIGWVTVILLLFVLGESTKANRQDISVHEGRLVELEHSVGSLAGVSRIDRAEILALQERIDWLEARVSE